MTPSYVLLRDYRHSQAKHRATDWRTVAWVNGSNHGYFITLVLWVAKGHNPRYAIYPPRKFS